MFAYCGNNCINGYDPCGTCFHRKDFWNDCEQCGGTTIDERLKNTRGTLSGGVAASISTGIWSFGLQFALSADLKGNVAVQLTPYGGISTGTPSADISGVVTVTNAPDVESLEGIGYNIGASGAFGASIGADFVIIPVASGDDAYIGGSVSGGMGAGADVHITWGETLPIFEINIFDALESFLLGK